MLNEIVWPGLIVVPEAPNGMGGDAGLGGTLLLLNSEKKKKKCKLKQTRH